MMHAGDVPQEPVPEVGGDPTPTGRDRQPLPCPSDWTFELIETYHAEIARVARDFGLDTYPVQLEVITAEQMIDAYASVGMPVNYRHWSFGKQFIATDDRLVPVIVGSMGAVAKALEFYMGKNTPARKDYIIENLIADIA